MMEFRTRPKHMNWALRKILLMGSLSDLIKKVRLFFCKTRISEDVNTNDDYLCRVKYKILNGHVYVVGSEITKKESAK